MQEWTTLNRVDSCLWSHLQKDKIGAISYPQRCQDFQVIVRIDSVRKAGERKTYEEARSLALAQMSRKERLAAIDSATKALKITHPVFTWKENFIVKEEND